MHTHTHTQIYIYIHIYISNYITNAPTCSGVSAPFSRSCDIAFNEVIKCYFISFIYLLPTRHTKTLLCYSSHNHYHIIPTTHIRATTTLYQQHTLEPLPHYTNNTHYSHYNIIPTTHITATTTLYQQHTLQPLPHYNNNTHYSHHHIIPTTPITATTTL